MNFVEFPFFSSNWIISNFQIIMKRKKHGCLSILKIILDLVFGKLEPPIIKHVLNIFLVPLTKLSDFCVIGCARLQMFFEH